MSGDLVDLVEAALRENEQLRLQNQELRIQLLSQQAHIEELRRPIEAELIPKVRR